MLPEREYEQAPYAPIPHRNAEKFTHFFHKGHHEPYTCTIQHGHATILSRAQEQPTTTNKSIVVFQALSLYKGPLTHPLDEEIGREPGGVREKDVQVTWGIVEEGQ
jgi:hypothetical protein